MSGTRVFLENGKEHTVLEFVIAIEHRFADLQAFPEELVVRAWRKIFNRDGLITGWTPEDTAYPMNKARTKAVNTEQCGYFQVLIPWGDDYDRFLSMGYREPEKPETYVSIFEKLDAHFVKVAYRARSDDEANQPAATAANIVMKTPMAGKGKWHIAKEFVPITQFPVVYLWRCEIPAHFDIHSHVMSNHCAPLPAIWERSAWIRVPEVGYGKMDAIGPAKFGEWARIARNSTTEIAAEFLTQMDNGNFGKIYPFLSSNHTVTGCVMPMDMDYMHFNGYFGTPIVQEYGEAWWYCWNVKWRKGPVFVPIHSASRNDGQQTEMPPSDHGETWSEMSFKDMKAHKRWSIQLSDHLPLFKDSISRIKQRARVSCLPFYHFDPRRYTNAQVFSGDKAVLADCLKAVIQSDTWDGTSCFFAFKLYCSMGWAPHDPLLKEPLREFYTRCVADGIPLLNHCTPVGMYTHDREFYYDLLQDPEITARIPRSASYDANSEPIGAAEGLISATATYDADGWPKSFPLSVKTPDNKNMGPPVDGKQKRWWFVQNYVSPLAWKSVIKDYPNLKICFAHFGDSNHLKEDSWDDKREIYEPITTRRKLSIQFAGAEIDRENSHGFLADLIDLIHPHNRVFVDLSYVLLDEHSSAKFQEIFDWARRHKPILLERILWGTDWPLLGNELMVKSEFWPKENMLHRYAQAFRGILPEMPADFFVRACFLNPIQYLGLHGVSLKLIMAEFPDAWPWTSDWSETLFTDYTKDKLAEFYLTNPKLIHDQA